MIPIHKAIFCLTLPLVLALYGCSWTEYFVVKNCSSNSIFVSYTIEDPKKTFGIFSFPAELYALNANGSVNWNKKLAPKNIDTQENSVSVSLAPNTVLIFGYLHNDHYTHHDQEFINGREFNLKHIEIEVNLEVLHISKKYFDDHFKKQRGFIQFEVQ